MARSVNERASQIDIPEQAAAEPSAPPQVAPTLVGPQTPKQAKKQAKIEQKLEEQDLKAAKQDVKAAKHEIKAQKDDEKALKKDVKKREKADKKREKKHDKAVRNGEFGRITPNRAKKAVMVAKIIGPAVAPFALKAASAAREGYEQVRARRLGVPADELGSFSGRGAALHARIAGDAEALRDLRERSGGQKSGKKDDKKDDKSLAAEQFADRAQERLTELTSAVRAAERMPASRRRAAHQAVDNELAGIEDDLLRRFGV